MINYSGPTSINTDVQLAVESLHGLVKVEFHTCKNHCVLTVTGFELSNVEVIRGAAVYLVGAIAKCISLNLSIRAALFDEKNITRDLFNDVVSVICSDNNISDRTKQYQRNPWLWEGMSHLLFHLSLRDASKHPPEQLLTKTSLHLDVNDHGLDIIAIYGKDTLGISAGECKAYLATPSRAITDATKRLGEVDRQLRDAEIRSAINQMSDSLTQEQREKLVGAFWHDERAYFPMVCCDESKVTNWKRDRKGLLELQRPKERKLLVAAAIPKAGEFFDQMADSMRLYASGKVM